jgi:hypothetical protein
MRERTEIAEGTFAMGSSEGRGTSVVAMLPFEMLPFEMLPFDGSARGTT